MRITIIGNFGLDYKGTMAARAVPIARELGRLGHTVEVVVPSGREKPGPYDQSDGYRLVEMGSAGRRGDSTHGFLAALRHLLFGLKMTWRAVRARPDILYAFKPKGYAGLTLLVCWFLRATGLANVMLVLDADDWEGAGGWADREPGPAWETSFVTWHEQWCLDHADLVTVASREIARLSRRQPSEIVYVPNAASPASPGWNAGNRETGRLRLGISAAPIVLAYTRFLEFAPTRLLEAFIGILERIPDARLVVGGIGLHGEEREFDAAVKRHGLEAKVIQLGWTLPRDLPDIFAAADVALYPLDDTLLNRAKCPMKLVDLLLAGVPVVADAVGQATEYVVDGVTGFLSQPNDVVSMTSAALQILGDRSQGRALGLAARYDVLARWSWERQTRSIDQAIASLRKRSVSRDSATHVPR